MRRHMLVMREVHTRAAVDGGGGDDGGDGGAGGRVSGGHGADGGGADGTGATPVPVPLRAQTGAAGGGLLGKDHGLGYSPLD